MNPSVLDVVHERVQRLFGHKPSVATDTIVKGAIAGAIGGAVGTLAMAAFQQGWNRLATVSQRFQSHDGPSDEQRNRLKNSGAGAGEYPQSEPRSHHQRIS